MMESVQVRLEIIKTLLTQAHLFRLEPAGASLTDVAEPLVDWILAGSPVDADRVNPIGAAARQAVIQLEGIRRQALRAAEALRDTDWVAALAEPAPSPAPFEKLRLEEGAFDETVALLELPPTAKVTQIRINAMNPNGIFFPVFQFTPDGLLDSYQPFFSIVFSGQMLQSKDAPSP